ncbi:MAG: fructosamine kinase family protein [Lachnospiraceae bacterium]|nr:fructosamine kinase family protein [Lachnospiraceae bacterium]
MEIRSFDSLEAAIEGCFGEGVREVKRSYVGGGDINDASCLLLSNGERIFVKSNTLANKSFFDAEEAGLNAIASTGAVRTPKLLCKGTDSRAGISFLMMEMIDEGRKSARSWETFGCELAGMHKSDTSAFVPSGKFGFFVDNYIGASKQINTPKDTWIDFFRECRLEPQFKMAAGYFDSKFIKEMTRLLDRLDDLLTEPASPSLLHGDMWSGNVMADETGRIMLIDPAAYVGHPEADIAMTELFGRLPSEFYRAYAAGNLMQEGYGDRKDLYNLYHLTNHLNLFGSSYAYSVMNIVKRYV